MRFRRGEQEVATLPEPQVLGVEIDQESAALYAEFAEGRSLDQVYALWKDSEVTNPTIRQRAVAVLTAPHGYNLPYPHSDQSLGRLLHINEEVDGKQTDSLRERMKDTPELATELAHGLLYWLDTTGGRIEGDTLDSRYDYQSAIQHLLPIVDEETADKLFAHYPVNDLEPYWNMDTASGYQPLVNLLYDREIPRKYKDIGLAKWFEVAEQEEQGTVQPREEHERAIKNMAEFVQTWTYGEGVDDDIHTSIASFLESHTPAGTTYVEGFAARQVAEHITDEDVRFNFAWRHILVGPAKDWGHFRVENERDLALVEWMRKEAHKRELPQFDAKADALVQAYEEERHERVAKKAAEVALQARLRA
jgi:hypothetical protein